MITLMQTGDDVGKGRWKFRLDESRRDVHAILAARDARLCRCRCGGRGAEIQREVAASLRRAPDHRALIMLSSKMVMIDNQYGRQPRPRTAQSSGLAARSPAVA
jgi:hypothetical protein